ncbi:MAG: class I SAM-dependent methyltransferase [Waddliaceae bacterium]
MKLTAKIEPFDSFWEGPDDVEKGYRTFYKFYKNNYLKHIPKNKKSKILIISCGPGYFVNLLNKEGYTDVLGIDSGPDKIKYAAEKGLNCRLEAAFPFLENNEVSFDLIIAEQELNHLTKDEMLVFLDLCSNNLNPRGTLIVHSLNGANPITGSEALAQNIDHYNTMTEISLNQLLKFAGYDEIEIIPLNLYVFYSNPLNYVAILVDRINTFLFRFNFKLYGKSNKIFTKKISGICKKGS